MILTARNLRLLAIVGAWIATPVMMVVCYNVFARWAAAHFRIYDVPADYLAGVVTAVLLLALIQIWPIPAAHRRALSLLWLVRIGVTLGVMLAFEAIYRGDMPGYYLDGLALNNPFGALAFGDGTQNLYALIGIVGLMTEAYSAMKVIFAYAGLIALYIFYRAAVVCLGQEKIALLYLLGLFPSFLFWGSLLGKDPIVLVGIAIYSYGVARLIVEHRMSALVWVFVGLLIASFIRVWLGAIFIAPLVFTYVMAGRAPPLAKLAFAVIAVPGLLVAVQMFAQEFEIASTEELVATTDKLSEAWARGGSARYVRDGFDSLGAMLAFVPIGAFAALFRPLPLEIPNIFGIMAGLENAFVLGLFLFGLMRRGVGWLGQPILLWAAATVVVWGAVYGFVSYQNLGTAFRFRVQVVPILLFLGLYLAFAHHLQPHRRGEERGWHPPPSDEPTPGTGAHG